MLLILAGISITMLTGENGILTKATESKKQTQEANAKEKIEISIMSSYDKEGTFNVTTFKKEIQKDGGKIVAEEENTIIVEIDAYRASVDMQNGKILEFYKIGKEQPSIPLKTTYIGTREFIVEVDIGDREINKFDYYIDGEKKEESNENIFKVEGLEPSSMHKVKAIVEEQNGKSQETEEITIITEPVTYLYLNGNEFEETTGGLETYQKSFNGHWTNPESEVDGNGFYSSGTIDKNEDYIYLTAQHADTIDSYGATTVGIRTKKLIDFSQYKKLYVEAEFYTNYNNGMVIRLLDEELKLKQEFAIKGDEAFELKDINEMRHIVVGMHSSSTRRTSGNMKIKSIRLEK